MTSLEAGAAGETMEGHYAADTAGMVGLTAEETTEQHYVVDSIAGSESIAPAPASLTYTAEQLLSIEEVEREALGLFPVGKQYRDIAALKQELTAFSESKGFKVASQSSSFKCSNGPEPSSTQKRRADSAAVTTKVDTAGRVIDIVKRKRKSHRCNCDFYLKYSQSKAAATKGRINITVVSFRHTGGCLPSPDQLRAQKGRSGDYTKECLSKTNLKFLYELNRSSGLTSRQLRDSMKVLLPNNVPITSKAMGNVRKRFQQWEERGEVFDNDEMVSATDAEDILSDFNDVTDVNDMTDAEILPPMDCKWQSAGQLSFSAGWHRSLSRSHSFVPIQVARLRMLRRPHKKWQRVCVLPCKRGTRARE